MLSSLKLTVFNTGLPKTDANRLQLYMSPLFKAAKGINLKIDNESPLKPGQPLLGFCTSGGTETAFLKKALENPLSPAVIFVHDQSSSFAAGCELSARLNHEFEMKRRAPAIFCSIQDFKRTRSILQAASVASSFAEHHPNIGIIGDPSDWLIASGYIAEQLPSLYNMKTTRIPMEEFIDLCQQNNKGNPLDSGIEKALQTVINKYHLDGFTIRCFSLLSTIKNTSCIEVSKFNDKGITAACEGDIPSAVTMHILHSLSGKPVFMANPTSTKFQNSTKQNIVTFAHCTIPTKLCQNYEITTHYESGIGRAIAADVLEGKWTVARFGLNGNLMSDVVYVENPKKRSKHHCRTQIVTYTSTKFRKNLENGNVLGNHMLFVPGDYNEPLKIFSKVFRTWKK